MRKLLGLVVAGLLMGNCGGGGGGGGGGGSQGLCQQIGMATCQKACSCREGPTCAIAEGGITLDFDSESDCRGFFVTLGCSQGDTKAYNDSAACLTLVQAAVCAGTGADAALTFPSDMACQPPP